MNELPPFPMPHGPVIDAEATSSSERGHDIKHVSVSQKYPGWSQPAFDCLEKTTRLAEQFNHGTVGIAHLVLAMTLVPSAARQLQLRNIDVDSAFRSAMVALIDMERVKHGDPVAKTSSSELNSMLKLAGEFAENRDFQDISVNDLLNALNSLPPEAPAARHIRGGSGSDPLPALRAELETWAARIEDRIRSAIPPQQPVIDFQTRQDIAEIKGNLQALATQVRNAVQDPLQEPVVGANVNDPRPPEEEKTWKIDIPWIRRA